MATPKLTDQQIRVRDYRRAGKTDPEIAVLLNIAVATVRSIARYQKTTGKPGRPTNASRVSK